MAARQVVALIIVLVALFGVVGAYSSTFAGAVRDSPDSPSETVDNETVSVNQSEVAVLAESRNNSRYYFEDDQVTVYNNSTEVDAEDNYTWFKNNGTFKVDDSSSELNNTDANVTYGWYLPSNEQSLAREVALFAPKRGELFGIALGAAALLAGLAFANRSR